MTKTLHNPNQSGTTRYGVLLLIVALGASTLAVEDVQAQAPIYSLQGTVTDHAGRPLSGATVTATPASGASKTATTGTDGKYTISQLTTGQYTLVATHECCLDEKANLEITATSLTYVRDFTLEGKQAPLSNEIRVLQGVVRDAKSGTALAEVQIGIDNYYQDKQGRGGYQYFSVVSKADGSYKLEVNRGDVSLWATREGYDHLRGSFSMNENRTVEIPMRTENAQTVTLFGTVKSTTGKAVPSAYVNVGPDYRSSCDGDVCTAEPAPDYGYGQNNGDLYWYYEPRTSPWNSTSTDDSGRYELQVRPGQLVASVYADNHLGREIRISASEGGRKEVNFVVEPIPPDSVRIRGVVVDAKDGKPIPHAEIQVENQYWGHYNYTQAGAKGEFDVMTKPGYTLVTVYAWKHYWVPCGSPEPSGEPEPSAKPEPSSPSNGSSKPIREESPSPCAGGDGEREHDYYSRILSFVGQEGESKTMDFKLLRRPAADATFQGYVLNATSGKPVPKVSVSFQNEYTRDWGSATTDKDGSFKIQVHAGYYTIRTWADGYFDAVLNTEIASGQTKRIDLEATPGEKRYGGYHCCYRYMSADMAVSSGHQGGVPTPKPAMAPQSEGMGDGPSMEGNQAYQGAGGGLGPYKAPNQGNGTASSLAAFAALAALAGLAIWRRRREA